MVSSSSTTRPSLSRTFLIYLTVGNILVVCFAGALWILNEHSREQGEMEQARKVYVDQQYEKVRSRALEALDYVLFKKSQAEARLRKDIKARTYEAHAAATHIYDKYAGTRSKADIAKLIHDALYAVSWDDGKGYHFAEDMQGNELINRNNPELEGTNLTDLRDSKGVYIMREILNVVREKGEGFCSYHWNKPNHPGVLLPKYSYVKYFKPMDWVIGNGKYLKDEEKLIQQEVLKRFETLKIGKDGYIFAGTYQGISLTYPAAGKNVWDITDANGKKLVQEMVKTARAGGGFVAYHMPRLGQEKPAPKISYVVGIDDWQWYIGYGVYIDEIEETIAARQAELDAHMRIHTFQLVAFVGVLLVLTLLLTRYIAGRMADDLKAFASFFSKAAYESIRVPEKEIAFAEFENMARAANQMIEDSEKHQEEKEALQVALLRAQKMEAIGLMAGGVAHDLNNVLSGVINVPDLMLRKMAQDDPIRRKVELIRESGLRAAAIVDDLLTVGRGISCKKETIELNRKLADYLDSYDVEELRSRFPDIALETRFHNTPIELNCSIMHVNKIVLNLVANAMEEIGSRGTVRIATGIVDTQSPILGYQEVPPGRYAVLKVRDTGGGISMEDRERIFEPFYTSKVMGRSGTGLGLSIVWNTMQAHEGYIHLDSSSNGTEFTLYFPLSREPCRLGPDTGIDAPRGRGQMVLVVDDEDIQRQVARETLESLEYCCHCVESGEAAVEWLRHHDADAVLLDMLLGPGIDGLETYRRIIKIKPKQKAVVATGFAETQRVEDVLALGAGECLRKPYEFEQLAQAMNAVFQA